MSTKQESDDVKMKRIFLREMSKGNVKGALHAISSNNPGRVYHLNDVVSTNLETTTTVLDTLKAKHPPRHQLATETLVEGIDNPPFVHPVIFDCIQGQTIRSAALRTNGAAGPSGIDALGWKRMCTSFNSASEDLCNSLALLARRLCTVFLDPSGLAPLLSCRLIALDKKPAGCSSNWDMRDSTKNYHKSNPFSRWRRYSGCSWFHSALCWSESWNRGSCPCYEDGIQRH